MKSHISSLTSHSAATVVGVRPLFVREEGGTLLDEIFRQSEMISPNGDVQCCQSRSHVAKINRRAVVFEQTLYHRSIRCCRRVPTKLHQVRCIRVLTMQNSPPLAPSSSLKAELSWKYPGLSSSGRFFIMSDHFRAMRAERVWTVNGAIFPRVDARKIGGSGDAFVAAMSASGKPSSSAAAPKDDPS